MRGVIPHGRKSERKKLSNIKVEGNDDLGEVQNNLLKAISTL